MCSTTSADAAARLEMLLRTDRIGFAQPRLEYRIDVRRRDQAEVMHVIARGDRVDAA
jgi:hypothetical protein